MIKLYNEYLYKEKKIQVIIRKSSPCSYGNVTMLSFEKNKFLFIFMKKKQILYNIMIENYIDFLKM